MELKYNLGWELDVEKIEMIHVKIKYWKIICKKNLKSCTRLMNYYCLLNGIEI